MTLVRVDVHEKVSGIPALLEAFGLEVAVEALPAGDYLCSGAIVERKTVLDLHSSIVHGRFWPQLGRLRSAGIRPYLLVQGLRMDAGPLALASVQGALLAVVDLGVGLLWARDAQESARWIERLVLREGRRRRDRPGYSQRRVDRENAREAAVAAVPGVSVTKARALLGHFGSVEAIARASREELLLVPGIGDIVACAITRTLSSRGQGPCEPGPST